MELNATSVSKSAQFFIQLQVGRLYSLSKDYIYFLNVSHSFQLLSVNSLMREEVLKTELD